MHDTHRSTTDLEARVAELEHQLAAMRTEVRTRRLVVVDEHGQERIVADAPSHLTDDSASVRVQDPSGNNYAELVNVSGDDGETYYSELSIMCDGETAACLYAMPTTMTIPGNNRTAAFVLDNVTMLQRFWNRK